MSDFLDMLIESTGNELATIAKDGVIAGDVDSYTDTGAYILNAMLSGSIYGGMPSNKITMYAGKQHTGKSYFCFTTTKGFLQANPKARVVIFESEGALSKKKLEEFGIDTTRVGILPVATMEEFKIQSLKMINAYLGVEEEKRVPLLLILDSFGMLSTSKEMEDTAEGSSTRDMTRTSGGKGVFRVLTLKCSLAGIPFIVTNHVYADMSGNKYADDVISGGSGPQYAASNIIMLSKRKEKDKTTNEVIGDVIHCKLKKGRMTKPEKKVDVLLDYTTGLDRYYGLLPLALKYGIFTKDSTRIIVHDGSKTFESTIAKEPEKFYTKEVLDLLDKAAAKEFLFGQPEIEGALSSDDEKPEPKKKGKK